MQNQKQELFNIKKDKLSCGCQPRILAVDDNEFNIIPLSTLIKDYFDIDIEQCANGAEAVEMYREGFERPCKCNLRAYRLIFMDLNMPVMDGKEASKKILDMVNSENEKKVKVI